MPSKDFWSIVVYDPQTRSELQTAQPYPSKNSRRDALQANPDGSVDLYFGPISPDGREPNWTRTVPGKGWFTVLRLCGPLEPQLTNLASPVDIRLNQQTPRSGPWRRTIGATPAQVNNHAAGPLACHGTVVGAWDEGSPIESSINPALAPRLEPEFRCKTSLFVTHASLRVDPLKPPRASVARRVWGEWSGRGAR